MNSVIFDDGQHRHSIDSRGYWYRPKKLGQLVPLNKNFLNALLLYLRIMEPILGKYHLIIVRGMRWFFGMEQRIFLVGIYLIPLKLYSENEWYETE